MGKIPIEIGRQLLSSGRCRRRLYPAYNRAVVEIHGIESKTNRVVEKGAIAKKDKKFPSLS
jgi:hypothetical protein